jgi:hypothetical protein
MVDKAMNLNETVYGYRKGKGFEKRKGKRMPKLFRLGRDKAKANQIILFICAQWQVLKASGQRYWTEEALDRIQEFQVSQYSLKQRTQVPDMRQVQKSGLSFHQALDRYIENIQECSSSTSSTKKYRIKLARYLKDCHRDILLTKIGSAEIRQMMEHYLKPRRRKQTVRIWKESKYYDAELDLNIKIKKRKELISVRYADNHINELKRALKWFQQEGFMNLPKKREFHTIFHERRFLNSEHERCDNGKRDVFSLEDLKSLYENASSRLRQYIVLALNLGATGHQLNLRAKQVHVDCESPYIEDRGRTSKSSKRSIVGRWELWSKSVEICQNNLHSGKNSYGLMIHKNGKIFWREPKQGKLRLLTRFDPDNEAEREEWERLRDENRSLRSTARLFNTLPWVDRNGKRHGNLGTAWTKLLVKCSPYTAELEKEGCLMRKRVFDAIQSLRESTYSHDTIIPDKISKWLPFKALRNTGYEMIKSIVKDQFAGNPKADEYAKITANLYLRRSPKSVGKKVYKPKDYEHLAKALKQMEETLKPVLESKKTKCGDVSKRQRREHNTPRIIYRYCHLFASYKDKIHQILKNKGRKTNYLVSGGKGQCSLPKGECPYNPDGVCTRQA